MKKLWYGGRIYTMESEGETTEAVLVSGGHILQTGTYKNLANKADEFIDLQGAVMYPGFVDSHLHMIYQGEKLVRLDLSTARSKNDMLSMVKEAAKHLADEAWLFGEGWNENNFLDQDIPTLKELDAIGQAPIVLTRICHHAILANTAAIKASGLTNETASPAGGWIDRDEAGQFTGLFYEQAMPLITDTVSKEGPAYKAYLKKVLNLAIDQMISLGLTGGHTEDMAYFGHFMNPYTAFKETIGKEKHFKVNLLRHHEVFEAMEKSELTYDDTFIEPGAMKLFLDGSIGASTAALSKSYTNDSDNKGLFVHTDEEVEELIQLARTYNAPVAIHAIGDAAVEQALQAIEKYPVRQGQRDRLIHCSVLREDLINRMTKLPIVIDAQPAFVPSDFPWIVDALGDKRLKYVYPWKTLLEAGIYCAAGTDAPIEHIDPLETIYAAVQRKGQANELSNLPEQKISRFEAIRMYTYGSAQAISKEDVRGLIKEGYEADFSIFDADLFKGTSEDILKAQAVQTVVAGKIVYEGKQV